MARDPILGKLATFGAFTNWRLPTPDDLTLAREAGFTELIIGVPNTKPEMGFAPAKEDRQVLSALRATATAGLLPGIMVWAERSPAWMGAALPWLARMATEAKAIPVLDCEGPIRGSGPGWHRGTLPAQEAAEGVAHALDDHEWAVTGLPSLHESLRPLVQRASFVIPQAYTVWHPSEPEHWSHSDATFPGQMQMDAAASWLPWTNGSLIMGLSCYWAERPDAGKGVPAISARLNLVSSIAGAISVGADAVWFWKLETLKNPDSKARAFFGIGR